MRTEEGNRLWSKAKKMIPGGSQLLSKRSEQFLPGHWPSYYKKAKGIELWDLDGNRFLDMSIMGVGGCILGYADDDVNDAVKQAVDSGSMSTLNCPEEVELAEKLLSMHKWAGSVRYARTGGEATTVAVRIARAHTGKDKVAFCGYHGWHDWYLSANLADDRNLDGHLLEGLEPAGVPRGLKGTSIPFNYNDIESLRKAVENKDVGAVIMEPMRHHEPKDDFVKQVAEAAKEIDAVLIFDEITSGWRMSLGGLYERFKVVPDIVVYGKAMSNGYPMAAVIGKKEVMDAAQKSFISSTYWTERIGPAAAIATIGKMERKKVPEHLCRIGRDICTGWRKKADEAGLDIEILDAFISLPLFSVKSKEAQALSTFFTQEMLKKGYLAGKSVYVSYSHRQEHVAKYMEDAGEVFRLMAEAEKKGNIKSLLEGPVAHQGFKRLN